MLIQIYANQRHFSEPFGDVFCYSVVRCEEGGWVERCWDGWYDHDIGGPYEGDEQYCEPGGELPARSARHSPAHYGYYQGSAQLFVMLSSSLDISRFHPINR